MMEKLSLTAVCISFI